jgi:hypothetical protein
MWTYVSVKLMKVKMKEKWQEMATKPSLKLGDVAGSPDSSLPSVYYPLFQSEPRSHGLQKFLVGRLQTTPPSAIVRRLLPASCLGSILL